MMRALLSQILAWQRLKVLALLNGADFQKRVGSRTCVGLPAMSVTTYANK
jgi:hypothetical protein